MQVKYHGAFEIYAPEPDEGKPSTMVPGILHSKNEEGQDFYEVRDTIPETSIVALLNPGENTVVGASRGQLMAFPARGQRLYELIDAPVELTPEQLLKLTLDVETGALSLG